MPDVFTKQKRSEIMSKIGAKNTKPEMLVRQFLFSQGFRYRLHQKNLPGTPDIVLKKYNTVIIVNGCFWHGHRCPRGSLPSSNRDFWQQKIAKNRERDCRTKRALQRDGWKVLTVWQCETKDKSKLTKRLVRFLERGQHGRWRSGIIANRRTVQSGAGLQCPRHEPPHCRHRRTH